jgi:multiple sugar transport system permease protein
MKLVVGIGIWFTVSLAFGLACAQIAVSKRRSMLKWFWLGFFFWIISLVILLKKPSPATGKALSVEEKLEQITYAEEKEFKKRWEFGPKTIWAFVTYIFLGLLAFSMLLPFIWMLATSFMKELEVYQFPPRFIPSTIEWINYVNAMTLQPFGRYFLNTMIVAVCTVTGQLLFCSMAAYAFARMKFHMRDKLFALYLGTMMIPAMVTLIPMFLIINSFGWMNTYMGLFAPSLSSVWGIFLLRQFFLTIPTELEDAARVDGASEFRIFWTIVLPLSKPALATLAIFSFMSSWKDFLWPLIVTNRQSMRTLEVGIASFSNQYSTEWNLQMAAAVVVLLPIITVFFLAQRYIVRGITFTGMKG